MTDDPRYREIFEHNRRWIAARREQDPNFFTRLAREQHPEFLFIGCSDSRVPETEIMGLEPGDIFVQRNIANLVVNTDINCQSVLHYAVEVLHVRHIVVCGHYGCGGVAAAMQAQDLRLMNGWLREIRDIYRLHRAELEAIAEPGARFRRLVELNVREQCFNVIKTAAVQRHYLTHGYPIVHGWAYDMHDGVLHDLEVPFTELLDEVRQVYRLDPYQ